MVGMHLIKSAILNDLTENFKNTENLLELKGKGMVDKYKIRAKTALKATAKNAKEFYSKKFLKNVKASVEKKWTSFKSQLADPKGWYNVLFKVGD